MVFKPHGRFKIWVEGPILRIQAFESWNSEQSRTFFDQCIAIIDDRLTPGPWASLIEVETWLPTYESLEVLRALNNVAIKKGLRYEALVPDNNISSGIITQKILSPISDNYENRVFADVDQAKRWLTACLES